MWRVWDNMDGTVNSYAAASRRMESVAFQSAPLGDNFNPATIPAMQGLTTFGIIWCIPEPSTHALLVVGLGALLLRRRK